MKRVYVLAGVLMASLLTFSCSSSDDNNVTNPEIEVGPTKDLSLSEVVIGQRGGKQLNYNSEFPISFVSTLSDKEDTIALVKVALKDGEVEIVSQEFKDVDSEFYETITLSSDEYSLKDNTSYTLQLVVKSKNGLEKTIEEQVRFVNFYIENVEVMSYDNRNDYPNQLFLNSSNGSLQFLDVHYEGELKEVRYFYENKSNPAKSFYVNTNVKDFKNDEENLVYLSVSKDNQLDENGKAYIIESGDYNLYLQYKTNDTFFEPILLKSNIKINDPLVKYDLKQFVVASDKEFTNIGKYTFTNSVSMRFYIKGLKELMLGNEGIRSIGFRVVNTENNTINASGQNFIFSGDTEKDLLDSYLFQFNYRADLSTFDTYVDIDYSNGASESINLGKITRDEK
ncbi:hypothetical protein [Myroides injenensis]|uniref:hypothetical protein n=1 Tax=Myroides injenensis TaxID=1183151 RepID=UPI000288D3F1|nr:hypothetical protein [Myroides injenensis]